VGEVPTKRIGLHMRLTCSVGRGLERTEPIQKADLECGWRSPGEDRTFFPVNWAEVHTVYVEKSRLWQAWWHVDFYIYV
jgi:hypothetical protein